ncbi:unnamed protein product [Phytophthora lilii]|uniref:Unnamed protein product n=1 Tax=Phytophthora lilii TaxID=2077276 RepID=A0A9W6TY64_9STRA|nr:unnamed protein product [Phytophthora lilii]
MKEALVAELERVKHTTGMTAVGIHSLNFGTAPPKINGIKCFDETEHDQVALDVDLLVVTKNSEIVLSFGNPLLYATTNVEVSDIVLRGTLRAEFKPLFPWWPTLGAVAVSFIDRPTVDFQLKVLHINVMDLPSLSPILHKAVYSGVERCCLWPNKIVIPFVEDLTLLEVETLTENHSLGMLVLRDLRVSGVNPSRAYSRWSGVYGFCLRFSMGKESVATETIRGQTSFEFTGKAYKLLVLDPEIQDLAVTLECSEVLQTRKHINTQWIHLNNLELRVGCSKQVSFGCDGDCRAEFELSWYPFTRQKHSPEAEVEPLPEDIARSGVVFIKLLRCEDLASMDISGTSDPYVVFHVGCQSKRSSVKRHTLNPVRPTSA